MELFLANYLLPSLVGIGLLLGLAIGFLWAKLNSAATISALKTENHGLSSELDKERAVHESKIESLNRAQQELSDQFSRLSQEALAKNNDSFLKLAEQNLKAFQVKAEESLQHKEKNIEGMVKPIKDVLEQTKEQIRKIEVDRVDSFSRLSEQLKTMSGEQARLSAETTKLSQSLSKPEVRGSYGELQLKRSAELAGMVEYCDFYQQESFSFEGGNYRPDMVVRMPDDRELVVDAKTNYVAYQEIASAETDEQKNIATQRYVRHLRQHIDDLAKKDYTQVLKHSADFVVMFLPGEHFLATALEADPELMETAMKKRVILATPTTLIALLRAVAFGWRQQALADNAEKIREIGEDLYKRMAVFSDHLSKVGSHLEKSVKSYNAATGSFQRQLMPGARKFTELGLQPKKTLEEPNDIETLPRNSSD